MLSVGRVPNPLNGRVGLAGGRPLAERYELAKAMALREIKPTDPEYSGIFNKMISEESIDAFYADVARATARRAPTVSPELQAEWNELVNVQHRYNAVAREIIDGQKTFLWRCTHDWRHKLLRSTKADMFTAPPIIDTDWDTSEYPDILSARKAIKAARAQLDWVLEIRGQISNAAGFDECPPEMQAIHLIHALYDDGVELRERVKTLEAQLGAVQAQPNRKTRRKVTR